MYGLNQKSRFTAPGTGSMSQRYRPPTEVKDVKVTNVNSNTIAGIEREVESVLVDLKVPKPVTTTTRPAVPTSEVCITPVMPRSTNFERTPTTLVRVAADGTSREELVKTSSKFFCRFKPEVPAKTVDPSPVRTGLIPSREPSLPVTPVRAADPITPLKPVVDVGSPLPVTPDQAVLVRTELMRLLSRAAASPWLQKDPFMIRLMRALSDDPYQLLNLMRDDANSIIPATPGPKPNRWVPYFNHELYATSECQSHIDSPDGKFVMTVGLAGLLPGIPIIYPFGSDLITSVGTYSDQDVTLTFTDAKNGQGQAFGRFHQQNQHYVVTLNRFERNSTEVDFIDLELPILLSCQTSLVA